CPVSREALAHSGGTMLTPRAWSKMTFHCDAPINRPWLCGWPMEQARDLTSSRLAGQVAKNLRDRRLLGDVDNR
ncbi:MAG TPA: hypothetical protein VEH53_06820, partial [archaeon]|nr:hypothetical protein [archaeon]